MRKIIVILVAGFFILKLYPAASELNNSFVNKKYGVKITVPAGWTLYTDAGTAPDYFKKSLENKKTEDDSPLFLGIEKTQASCISCSVEPYSASLAEYLELYKSVKEQKNISINDVNFSADKASCIISYGAKLGSLDFSFIEYMTLNNGFVIRLTFWTLANLFENKKALFYSIMKNFSVDEGNAFEKNWTGLLLKSL